MKTKTVFSAFLLFSVFLGRSFAAPTVGYEGEFKINPTGATVHKAVVTAKISLSYENNAITQVEMKLDQKVMGKDDYVSSEQFSVVTTNGTDSQLAFAYKIKGAPHKWYYVGVLNSTDGITFQGNFYKVSLPLDDANAATDIKRLITAGIDLDPAKEPAKVDGAHWKNVLSDPEKVPGTMKKVN